MRVDSGNVNVNDTVNWVLVSRIIFPDAEIENCVLQVNAVTNPLTDLKITRSAVFGGDPIDWYVGSDFSTPTADMPLILPSGINTLPAGGKGLIKMTGLFGTPEISIWAKAANAQARILGTFL
jgi:hypothetical protein